MVSPWLVDELINLELRIAAHDIPLPYTELAVRLHCPDHPIPVSANSSFRKASNDQRFLSDID